MKPDDLDSILELAHHYKRTGMPGAAEALFTPVVLANDNGQKFRALLERADCRRLLGKFAAAEADIHDAQAIDGGSHWPVQQLSELYAATGRDSDRLPLIATHYNALRPDGKAAIARYEAEIKAYWHFEKTRSRPSWKANAPVCVKSLAKAGIMMLVKDEEDIIGQNLKHHYALGFRAFCILNNSSADNTRLKIDEFLKSHEDCFTVVIDDPVRGHYQSRKMTVFGQVFVEHARLNGTELEWMFYLDADEFIATGTDGDASDAVRAFNDVLNDQNVDLIVMHWIHGTTNEVHETLSDQYSPFESLPKLQRRLLPVVPKIAMRTTLGIGPMEGNHFVSKFAKPLENVRTMALSGWYLYHFPLRSLSQVKTKVINGGRAYQGTIGLEEHGDHWRQRFALYKLHGEPVICQILENFIADMR